MATYVPNVKPYLPNVKAFTPDYKFLSDTLQKKQNKYDTNYKQLNNAYSRIMYAGLSREDTNEARDQFVNNLQPELEKISGLDLSLGQNVKAAQAVFEPFYDNNLVMKDMVMTKDYRNKMTYAQQLATSTNEEESDRYWDEGVKLLKYKMDDFINASQEEALNTQLPSYIENPRLYKRAMNYLQEKGYKVKYDTLSPGGDFIVTDVNGKNITATAMADLKMRFQNNDVIKKGYYAKSYVDSRQYAENQLNAGNVNSISEGVLKYNTGTIETYKAQNELNVVKYNEQITSLNTQLESVKKQLKGQALKPGSPTDNNIKLIENQIQGLEMQKEMSIKTAAQAERMLSTGDAGMINGGAFNIQMQSNITKDLSMAASNYSMLTAERTFKVNQAELQRRKEVHDVKLTNMRFQQDVQLKKLETQEQKIRIEDKLKLQLKYGITESGKSIGASTNASALGQIAKENGLVYDEGLVQTEDIKVSDQEILKINENYLQNIEKEISGSEVQNYINATTNKDKLVELPDGIQVKEEHRKFVTPGEDNKAYVSQDMFRVIVNYDDGKNYEVFQKANQSYFKNLKVLDKSNSVYKTNYDNNQEKILSLKKKKDRLYEISKNNLEIARGLAGKKNDMPILFQEQNGEFKKLSKEELYNLTENKILNSNKINYKYLAYNSLLDKGLSIITLKDKNAQVWQDLKNGDISKTIIRINKNGDEEEIVNPAFFQVKLYKKLSEKQNDFDKEKQVDIANFMKSTGLKKYNVKQSTNSLIDQVPVINYANISRESDKSYDEQILLLDKINKNKYTAPGEGDAQQVGFEYVNFMSGDRNDTTPFSDMPDLYIGQSKTFQLNNEQTEDGATIMQNKNTAAQALYLFDALSQPQTEVSQNIDRINANDILLRNSNQAKTFMYNQLKKWQFGNLDNKYTYNITYTPAVGNEQFSKYKITRSQTIPGSQKKGTFERMGQIEVKVPVGIDKNKLNIKNDKTQYIINDLIDTKTNTYTREFDNGSSINILYSGGQYNIDYTLMQYDPKTDDFTTEMTSDLLSGYGIESLQTPDVSLANEKYEDMSNWFSKWNFNQLQNAARHRKEFYDYLNGKEPKEGDWEKFLKIKR